MARRKRQAKDSHSNDPMYGWALDDKGRPIPIAAAQRGAQGYACPICGGPMVARKGDIKQHHFAHETLYQCTPENVATAIAGKWLVLELGTRMVLGKSCLIQWNIADEHHTANILEDITSIVEGKPSEYGTADIALVNAEGKTKTVLSLNISGTSDELAITRFSGNGIAVVILPTEHFRSGQVTLDNLFLMSEVRGGWWLLGENSSENLQADPSKLQEVLKATVAHPPYHFWGSLQAFGSHKHVLNVYENHLWLPYEVWQTAVGGTRNQLGNDLMITVQEWQESDGSVIVLYYVMLREDDRAIAVRRFRQGEHVHATLNVAYRMKRTTAEDVARLLATS